MSERLLDNLISQEREVPTTDEALKRGIAFSEDDSRLILPSRQSLRKEMEERRIKLYLGIDPTSPNLHIGHTVPLRKLRQFQDLGHEVLLLFGTFTAKVGDPTEKKAARVRMSTEQIEENVTTYIDQASKILDLSKNAKNPIEIVYNEDWLGKLTSERWLELLSEFTAQQMIQRKGFRERWDSGKGIALVELIYPLFQAYDAYELEVDLEVGGKDQVFNMLAGRDLVGRWLQKEKWVMGTQLIEDPTGKKMGKTEGNIVNIYDYPEVKYEGLMLWPDTSIGMGFELVTSVPMNLVHQINQEILPAVLDNRSDIGIVELKEAFAYRTIAELDGTKAADYAATEFDRVKRKGELPQRMKEVKVKKGIGITELLINSGLVENEKAATERLRQSSVYVNRKQVGKRFKWDSTDNGVISIGSKTIKNIRSVKVA